MVLHLTGRRLLTVLLLLVMAALLLAARAQPDPVAAIRYNHLGYLPQAPKVAVLCSRDGALPQRFEVRDARGRTVHGPVSLRADGGIGGCVATARLDFSRLKNEGTYTLHAGDVAPVSVRIDRRAYEGIADSMLAYLRQQRSLFNPFLRDSAHHRTDGILVDHPRAGEFIYVSGGWADAADYLQYVTTSAHATFAMLAAWRDNARIFGDRFDAAGLPGGNGLPDVLDEARWGLEWLVRMHPEPNLILNQLGDDRDHAFLDLPNTDSSDYGWGKAGFRPVYPCTGKPQGIVKAKNRADGMASTAGKLAAAFALGARTFRERDPGFAATLTQHARDAYQVGRDHPGACQTAPGGSPYFYEEANWVDDMELGAAELFALTGERRYLAEAREYADREPVTPWMGRDTARHYEYYPWYNPGHHSTWKGADGAGKKLMVEYYRRGLDAVAARAQNGFRIGIPFIWCSNNLLASWATQAALYRHMGGGNGFREHELAAVDWLFGTNPWGTSMVIGIPDGGDVPVDPHSVMSMQIGPHTQKGGLVDGPVYRSIYQNLKGIALHQPDEYEAWNTGAIVYHDDRGDYSTNEPIMDGTAVMIYMLAVFTK